MERCSEVVADLAAQTSGLQLDNALLARLDQVMVEADLPELVDDHSGSREFRPTQQVSEQRRLAAPKEAGENQSLDHVGTSARGAMRARIVAYPGSSTERTCRSTATSEIAGRLRLSTITIHWNGKSGGACSMRMWWPWQDIRIAPSFVPWTVPVSLHATSDCVMSACRCSKAFDVTAPTHSRSQSRFCA